MEVYECYGTLTFYRDDMSQVEIMQEQTEKFPFRN